MKRTFIYCICLFLFSCTQKQAAKDDFTPLFPFVISYDGPDNVTNMSHLLDAPAGKYGFVRIENGKFVNDAGEVRLNATNLTGSANFPSHEQADKLAERLARFGLNCVRLHYMDADYANFMEEAEPGIINQGEKTQRNLDPGQMDRFDYMIAQFKKKGIYVNINLHVARKMDERDGFTGEEQRPHLDKGVDNFEPRMIELQKEYAKKLLAHVNTYTGLPYTNDPCVAMVEINNENALMSWYHRGDIDMLPDPYSSELKKQWNEWLLKKYVSTEKLCQAWNQDRVNLEGGLEDLNIPTVPSKNEAGKQAVRDFYQFILDTEENYWLGMYYYLKNDLKLKSVVSGTQLGYTSPFIQAQFDYIDIHSYWCHPSPVSPDWKIRNQSMVNSLSCIQGLASQRIAGMAYTVSEYNHPFPNQYGAEGQPMLRAYGRLQGWDGVFQYTYNHRLDFKPECMTYFFDMIARTDVLAHMPACATIFLRGDVSEAKTAIKGEMDYPEYFNRLIDTRKRGIGIDDVGLDSRLTLLHKTAMNLTGKSKDFVNVSEEMSDDQKVYVSDTGELTWNMEKEGAGYWTVNTTNTKLFTGFPEGRIISLGDVTLDIGETRLGWGTISLVSKNATGFGESGQPAKILLTATGLVENKGMEIEQVSDTEIKLSDWGGGPIMAEGIPAKITLVSDPGRTKCFALDPHGDRKQEVPVKKMDDRTCEIVIGSEYQTIWYEVVVE